MNPCASLSVSLGLDQKSAVSVSVSTSETFRSQSQSRVSTRQGSGLSLSLNPKSLGLVGCWCTFYFYGLKFSDHKTYGAKIVKRPVIFSDHQKTTITTEYSPIAT